MLNDIKSKFGFIVSAFPNRLSTVNEKYIIIALAIIYLAEYIGNSIERSARILADNFYKIK